MWYETRRYPRRPDSSFLAHEDICSELGAELARGVPGVSSNRWGY